MYLHIYLGLILSQWFHAKIDFLIIKTTNIFVNKK